MPLPMPNAGAPSSAAAREEAVGGTTTGVVSRRRLREYLHRHKVSTAGQHFTHTCFGGSSSQRQCGFAGGKFNIPPEDSAQFFDVYSGYVVSGGEIALTERHGAVGPILVDIDLRFPGDRVPPGRDGAPASDHHTHAAIAARFYTRSHVDAIATAYAEVIAAMVTPPNRPFRVVVMEKPAAGRTPRGEWKDGLHIVVPDVVVSSEVRHIVRARAMEHPALVAAISDIAPDNPRADVVDEAVVERNGWMMYGSRKPGACAYTVSAVYNWPPGDGGAGGSSGGGDGGGGHRLLSPSPGGAWELAGEGVPDATRTRALVELLAVSNKYDDTPLVPDAAREAAALRAERDEAMQRRFRAATMQVAVNRTERQSNNIDEVRALLGVLRDERAASYREWIMLGWCLRNIDHRLLPDWVAFSRKSDKYQDGECERLWNHMRETGLGMGTLHMWAREDAPERYSEVRRGCLTSVMYESLKSSQFSTYHIANVVRHMCGHTFACTDVTRNYWYHFNGSRWSECPNGIELLRLMSEDVRAEYMASYASYVQRSLTATDDMARERFEANAKHAQSICTKLLNIAPKKSVLEECKGMMYNAGFASRLDSNTHLLGFENGVMDLLAGEFRSGRPDDAISMTTAINYVEHDADSPAMAEVQAFLDQVLPVRRVQDYVLNTLAEFLSGRVRHERFHIWTGSGSNGKSKLIELYESCLGDYACKLPISLLTQKRAQSGSATSEIARTKGRRFAVLQEPSEDEKLNVGLMKELCGGDKIQARSLFKEPVEFKPQFSMILTCNHLPTVPSDDGGTWRRIRVVEFKSRFVIDPDPARPEEYRIDVDLPLKFEAWKEPFMAMLIARHAAIAEAGGAFPEPPEVTACTREYQRANDVCKQFVDECLQRAPANDPRGGFLDLNEAWMMLKAWCKEASSHGGMGSVPSRGDFFKSLVRILDSPVVKRGARKYVRGWMCVDPREDDPMLIGDENDAAGANAQPGGGGGGGDPYA